MIEEGAILGAVLFLVVVAVMAFVAVRKQGLLNAKSRASLEPPPDGPPEDTYDPVPKTSDPTTTMWRVDVTISLEGKHKETIGWTTSGCVSEEDARDSHLLVSFLDWFNNEPESASYVAAAGTATDFVLVRSTIRWVRIDYRPYEEPVND